MACKPGFPYYAILTLYKGYIRVAGINSIHVFVMELCVFRRSALVLNVSIHLNFLFVDDLLMADGSMGI